MKDLVQELEESVVFFEGLKAAKQWKLDSEYVVFYTRGIQKGMTITEAVNYARREWDF